MPPAAAYLSLGLCLCLCLCLPGAATQAALPDVKATLDIGAATTPFPHYWKRCFGSGHHLLATRVDWRQHLQVAVDQLGLGGVRMHGIFDDDMSVLVRDGYHFYNVDVVYDYLVELGLKPVVELSFMPYAIANCSKRPAGCSRADYAFGDPGSYKGLRDVPADYNEWYKLVYALAQHFVERYGLAEVATWRFEVWNELWGMPYPDAYLPLYNASAAAIKAVDPVLRVGGPATMQVQHVQDFIADTERRQLPRDFVSTHLYPSDPNCTTGPGMYDQDCFLHTIRAAHDLAADAGLPFLMTEYNDGLQGGDHRDTAYAAAFVFRYVPQLTMLDALSWWTFTDVFEEGSLVGAPFSDAYGLMTVYGVPKPAWRAFELLAGAGDVALPVAVTDAWGSPGAPLNVSVAATLHGRGSATGSRGLQLFIANFAPGEGSTAAPSQPVDRNLTIAIASLPPNARATVSYINDATTAPRRTWEGQGSPTYPTAAQIAAMMAASAPRVEEVVVPAGTLTLTAAASGAVHVHFY